LILSCLRIREYIDFVGKIFIEQNIYTKGRIRGGEKWLRK